MSMSLSRFSRKTHTLARVRIITQDVEFSEQGKLLCDFRWVFVWRLNEGADAAHCVCVIGD